MTNHRNPLTYVAFAAFVGTVYAANWAIARWGFVPVGFGLEAPAGVYFAGLAFGLRDALHELGGRAWILAAIAAGAALSWLLADPVVTPDGFVIATARDVAIASAVAFGLSELLDALIYTPLRERRWTLAVILSGAAGAVADSVLFLWIAFGNLDNIAGLLVGKAYMVIAGLLVVGAVRARLEAQPAPAVA